ncbi:MAG: elongation factor G [Deltaproteobacteria bacterium]|jgi:elongation factor G|nr:elongation factor G [Deltaproteobacteria bacterium]
MKDVAKQRTIALIAHGGSGKTTLAEAFLFLTKTTSRFGSVTEGTSVLDFEPEEIKRKSSVNAAFHSFPWKKCQITFADTPGGENFLNDTRTVSQGVDGAVVLVDAVDMVKVSTEKGWAFSDAFGLPRIVVINKMDRERADFQKTLENIQEIFTHPRPIPIAIPIGAENSFKGVVDLLRQKAFVYDNAGKATEGPIPAELTKEVAESREKLIEAIAETDDVLVEKFLEGQEITDAELDKALKAAVLNGQIAPVTVAAGLKLIGLDQVLDLIIGLLPSPLERKPFMGAAAADGEPDIAKTPDPAAPFSGLTIKTIVDPFAGQLTIFRIISGSLTPDSGFLNVTRGQKERFGLLFALEGKAQKAVDEAGPGDIVAVSKLKSSLTGDSLAEESAPIFFPAVKPMEPVVSFAVEAKTKGDEEKVFAAINKMTIEDVTLRLTRNNQTKEMILAGMGQVHLDTVLEKIKRKYGVDVVLKAPKVAFKETIKGRAKVQGKYKKQTGGKGQYGDAVIELEPLPRGEGFVFEDKIVGGVIPRQYIPAVEKGIVEAMAGGVVSGNPVVDCKVALVFGSYHDVDSSEMAFKIAGSMAFKKAFMECKPTILEPIMLLTVTVPDEFMGDVMGDISSRRGKLLGTESHGKRQVINAHVPQMELLSYSPSLTSMTGGRGDFSLEFAHYDEAPAQVRDKVISEYQQPHEEKE